MDTTKTYNVAFDIETNGLESTRLHCIVLQDVDNGIVEEFNDEPYGDGSLDIKADAPMKCSNSIANGLSALMCANNIISHNGIAYDVPQAKKHYPFFRELKTPHWDTLILSRFFYPDLLSKDQTRNAMLNKLGMPAKLRGSHSLEAWGYRLRCRKGAFSEHTNWENWSPEMQDYCKQDVAVLVKLWKYFQKKSLEQSS